VLTAILIDNANVDNSTELTSQDSVNSYSSDEAASGALQHNGRLPFQLPPKAQPPFPFHPASVNPSQIYTASNIDANQYPEGLSYAANMYPPFCGSDSRITVSASSGERLSMTVQPPYSTMRQRDPVAQSPGTPWGAPVVASRPIPSNLSYGVPAIMDPPDRLDYAFSQGPPYHPENNRGINYENPLGNSYIGETDQRSNWSEQPPSNS
jgi:hypothetical protein